MPRKLVAIATSFALTISLALAEDEIQRRTASIPVRGTITEESANEITIQRKDTGKAETISVHEVAKVKYEGGKAAAEFTQAESLERGGEYQKAIEAYGKIGQEYADKVFLVRAAGFGRVSSLVRLAQRDPDRMNEAIQALENFRKQHPDSRFHYTLHEMLGQLYLGQGRSEEAKSAFTELSKAPWPSVKLKATNYEGRVLLATNQLDAAIAKFQQVAGTPGDDEELATRRYEAQLGTAECMIKQKKHEDAEKTLRELINNASHDESTLQAAAHNFLGDVLRETGRAPEAIFAYLYVDAFYPNERDQHAKALCYIALLFDQRGRNDRADDARSRLKKDYPSSPWVKISEGVAK